MKTSRNFELAGSVAQEIVSRHMRPRLAPRMPQEQSRASAGEASGRYDFDLAEFPLFRYSKRRLATADLTPLIYADTIVGRDGEKVRREWKCYPGAFGFGGATAQQVLYELVQLYISQGCRGSQIQF